MLPPGVASSLQRFELQFLNRYFNVSLFDCEISFVSYNINILDLNVSRLNNVINIWLAHSLGYFSKTKRVSFDLVMTLLLFN